MSGTKSKTIFRRSKVGFEASDPSGWNDLAIIKAYDSAIATDLIMDDFEDDSPKVGDVVWKRNQGVIEKQSSESAAKATGASKKAKKRKRKNAKNNLNNSKNQSNWKVGDSCMAFYQEDQRYYKAVVKQIHTAQGTVVINYVDYDDDEVVALKDIYPESLWTDAGVNLNSSHPEAKKKNIKKARITKNPPQYSRRPPNSSDVELSYESSLPFMPNMGDMGPDMSSIRNMTKNCSTVPKEALSSMLVSWYMAGYQTGYYRGLTASQK